MKKTTLILSILLAWCLGALAQDCVSGYCPDTLYVKHGAGEVAPESVDIAYKVTESNLASAGNDTPLCWLAQNLGASTQASSAGSTNQASRGWFWQFNRKQGFAHDGTTRTPNTEWITTINEDSGWLAENDPCTITLGSNWRLPTLTEWTNADINAAWGATLGNLFTTDLKLHAAGYLYETTGTYTGAGVNANYWSSTQSDNLNGQDFAGIEGGVTSHTKSYGFSIRCIRSY